MILAYKSGCKGDAWTEHFKEDVWRKVLAETGITENYFALNQLDPESAQPWEIVDSGISKEFLKSEWNKALKETTTRDCRYGCNGCGINRYADCKCGGIYE